MEALRAENEELRARLCVLAQSAAVAVTAAYAEQQQAGAGSSRQPPKHPEHLLQLYRHVHAENTQLRAKVAEQAAIIVELTAAKAGTSSGGGCGGASGQAAGAEAALPAPEPTDVQQTKLFEKFTGGFEGSFAETSAFFGGLDKLIGEPEKSVLQAMRAEHCEVAEGFGASDAELTAGNYGVTFTPRKEFMFVADPRLRRADASWHGARDQD